MKTAGYAIVGVVLIIWAYLILASDRDPTALKTLAGCYRASADGPAVRVTEAGRLTSKDIDVAVEGYRDKVGIGLLPAKKVIPSPTRAGHLEQDHGEPLIIRSVGNAIVVTGDIGTAVSLTRVSCPR